MNLGRIKPGVLDPRNKNFPVRQLIKKASKRTYRYWNDLPTFLNQGDNPFCVGYAWTHFLNDGPVKRKRKLTAKDADDLYHMAQIYDEFPGTNYEGTSTLGGVKAAQELGYIDSYHWAFNMDDLIQTVLELGPCVVGTDWYNDMFYPRNGLVKVSGGIAGGHEWEINGVNVKRKLFRAKNSWGKDWGDKGRFWITFDDFEKLMYNMGEVCIALEK